MSDIVSALFGFKKPPGYCPHFSGRGDTLRLLPVGPAWLCAGCRIAWDEDWQWPVTQSEQPPISDDDPLVVIHAPDDLPW